MTNITIQDSGPLTQSLRSLLSKGITIILDTNAILSARYHVQGIPYSRESYSNLIKDAIYNQINGPDLQNCLDSFIMESEKMHKNLNELMSNPRYKLFTIPEVVSEINAGCRLLEKHKNCRIVASYFKGEPTNTLLRYFNSGIIQLENLCNLIETAQEDILLDGPFRCDDQYWNMIDYLCSVETSPSKPFASNNSSGNNRQPLNTDLHLVATGYFTSGLYSGKSTSYGCPVAILSNDNDIDSLISGGSRIAREMFPGFDLSCSKIAHRTGRLIKRTQIRHISS
ncbi:hypothetical protein J4471_01295 [Candidatus Woesearchaeota archaeon]|nr:hypothetical protein [Candidatus Woesearchaeota archaeon]